MVDKALFNLVSVEAVIRFVTSSNKSSTDSLPKSTMLVAESEVCVNINAACQRGPDYLPFTGRKDSAVATLSVHDALRSFSIRTVVASGDDQKKLVGSVISSGESKWMTTDYLL